MWIQNSVFPKQIFQTISNINYIWAKYVLVKVSRLVGRNIRDMSFFLTCVLFYCRWSLQRRLINPIIKLPCFPSTLLHFDFTALLLSVMRWKHSALNCTWKTVTQHLPDPIQTLSCAMRLLIKTNNTAILRKWGGKNDWKQMF